VTEAQLAGHECRWPEAAGTLHFKIDTQRFETSDAPDG
jgi:hypothetical protein